MLKKPYLCPLAKFFCAHVNSKQQNLQNEKGFFALISTWLTTFSFKKDIAERQ